MLTASSVAAAAPGDTGSLSGSSSSGSLSGTAPPTSPAAGSWTQNPISFDAAEGSDRTFTLGWQPSGGEPRGTVAATVAGSLGDIATVDPGLSNVTDAGLVEIPLSVAVPSVAADSYTGTVQLADDTGSIGPPLQVTVAVGHGNVTDIPAGITAPTQERIAVVDDAERVADEVLILVDTGGPQSDIVRSAAAATEATIFGSDPDAGLYQLRYRDKSTAQMQQVKDQLRTVPGVLDVFSNYIAAPTAEADWPNDPKMKPWAKDTDANWGLRRIDALGAWKKLGNGGDPNVRVGVVDVGPADDYHEDLIKNMARSPHVGSGADYLPDGGQHPSHVAGIACATGDNGVGITGVAQRCDLRSYSTSAPGRRGYPLATMISRMSAAARDKARVVNISLGFSPKGSSPRPTCKDPDKPAAAEETVREFRESLSAIIRKHPDTLWVTSAGNSCMDAKSSFPAALASDSDVKVSSRVVTVAASTKSNKWASYSNFGKAITLVAPGGDDAGMVLSTVPECKKIFFTSAIDCRSGYRGDYGTSMAAPYVTGTAALMLSKTPSATPAELKSCLERGGGTITRPGDARAYPTLNAANAVQCITKTTPPDPTDPGEGGDPVPPTEPAASISASYFHSCGLLTNGGVRCWGRDAGGNLGNGAVGGPSHATPVDVVNIRDATSVATGASFSCATLATGNVQCWGSNMSGELGSETPWMGYGTPMDVTGITDAISVSAGIRHACAVLATGNVRCWGNNGEGQLGDGTVENRAIPRDVVGITDAIAVTAGSNHTCALLSTGGVRCWGSNTHGQVGDGTTVDFRTTPVAVIGVTNATSIDAGEGHTCAVLATGGARCWGIGVALGDGSGIDDTRSTPVDVNGLSNAHAIASGGFYTCATLTDGRVQCWGANLHGGIGDGSDAVHATPVDVIGITGATSITAGLAHSCATLSDGSARCWGLNEWGQLGNGDMDVYSTPAPVPVLSFGPR
ncbi:S8 family serine peptidase [Rhodococcus hoagii]|nr:S8 family serine peptidase [Prescottella equi]MBM4654145.1 S8 family serine peptidase [Prescottella equi]MBM4719618.1 S8 family serine peptidase [Prescottella equi]NKT55972.1 S8 family serine peptidase [Prescottella equi]NKU37403.1 S8 family serine peptidase [Prescottella equi]